MKRILVTGCCGFIGSHLSERLLSDGFEVCGIDNFDPFYDKEIKLRNLNEIQEHSRFTFHECDLRNKDFYKAIDNPVFDAVIHLAAKTGVLPSLSQTAEYVETNISGTTHLLNFMKDAGINKLLFTSSSSVYGNNSSVPFREDDPVNEPISPYAFTKRADELQNYAYHHLYNIDIINLRLFTVYGPRQRPDLAIHKFVKQIDANQKIKMYGDGSTARDYTFVLDTIEGYMGALNYLFLREGIFEIVNLGNNKPVKLSELVQTIYELMGKKPDIEVLPQQLGDVDQTYADITKAGTLFGYYPKTQIRAGIKTFIDWFNKSKK